MKQKIHIFSLFLFLLSSFSSTAQQPQSYEWEWAMNGGGRYGGLGGYIGDEQTYDIKVGTDNNYYFIATLKGPSGVIHNGTWEPSTKLDGVPVPAYGTSNTIAGGTNDIFLFSTTCEGEVRWSRTIGGWMDDDAYNLVLDDQNNVYVGVNVRNDSPGDGPGTRPPLHFTENDSVPFADRKNGNAEIPQEGFKTTYLVKYNSNGTLVKRVALQGDVNSSNFQSRVLDLAISNNKLHFIVGFDTGTHLDGNVTVVNNTNHFKFFIAQYDLNLDYINSFELPVAPNTGFNVYGRTRFAYDENKNQYYIAGMRGDITGSAIPLTYEGKDFVERSFILAIDDNDGSEVWRREIYSQLTGGGNLAPNYIFSLVVDKDSDVYIGGTFFRHPNEPNVKIYDPTDASVQPYFFTPGVHVTVPMITKFNSDGDVQWAQAVAAFNQTAGTPGPIYAGGIAINNNEVALGAQGSNMFWDNIEIARPYSHQPDPMLVRFDKQSGAVIDVHDIQGSISENQRMTAVAVDNDGNYIAGGAFPGNLFMNNTLGITPLISTGQADFFVAKLANSECGSGNMSTEDFNKWSFNVYPNPTTGIINVETDEQLAAYSIYDATGRLVRQSMFNSNNQISLESASNGVYFIIITTVEGNSGTVKVVKR